MKLKAILHFYSVLFCAILPFGIDFLSAAETASVPTGIEQSGDWLLGGDYPATIIFDKTTQEWILENGLIQRRIATLPAVATVSLKNLTTGEELLRAVAPEGQVTFDGKDYPIGGLEGEPVANYIKEEWLPTLTPTPNAYRYSEGRVTEIEERFPWKKRTEWLSRDLSWPPKGKHLIMTYLPPKEEAGSETSPLPTVEVHYEIYDDVPIISKWLAVISSSEVVFDNFVSETLRLAETGSNEKYPLSIVNNFPHGGRASGIDVWFAASLEPDPHYPTQVDYRCQTPCLLRCGPYLGPAKRLHPGERFETFRSWELLHDGTDRERRGLAVRQMFRTLAPWTAENPLMFHKTESDPETVREAIRQCRETGFELIIMSFGSDLNLESKDVAYRALYAELSREAAEAGIALGGYSLTSSRNAGDLADNVLTPHPVFERGPCLCSKWGIDYLATLKSFMEEANFGVLENDGPYPGDYCEAIGHPGHEGKKDSLWNQWEGQSELFRWCRAHGVFVNQPDGYFLDGGNKSGMGYREDNWSLPRDEQLLIERQNIYDGTWTKTSTMGWMFVPLSEYHGGGAAATIEPLSEHLEHYEGRLANLLGSGVQACYRGPRLFDTEETKAMVKKWVHFYKSHRQVLDGDLIHLRRANGRDWDGWLNVNPTGVEKGLAFLYNPLNETLEKEISIPLYYTGLKKSAKVIVGDRSLIGAAPRDVQLDDRQNAVMKVEIPAHGFTWLLFTE